MTEEEKEPILKNDSENKEPIQESLPLSTPIAEAAVEEAIVEPIIEEAVVESVPVEIIEAPIIEEIPEPAVEEVLTGEIIPEKIEEPVIEPIVTEADPAEEINIEEKSEVLADNSEVPVAAAAGDSNFNAALKIIGVLLVMLSVIYFMAKKPADTEVPISAQNVKVSTTQEQGKVNILEEVKNDVSILGAGSEDIVYQKIKATAYLGNTQKNQNSVDCALAYPLEREIDKKYDSPMINAVLALLEPLTSAEKEQGFVSAIPAGTILKYLKLDDSGVMSVNLSGNISKAAGSCAVTAIRSAITNTLSQFSSVKSVIICVDGNCDEQEILQP